MALAAVNPLSGDPGHVRSRGDIRFLLQAARSSCVDQQKCGRLLHSLGTELSCKSGRGLARWICQYGGGHGFLALAGSVGLALSVGSGVYITAVYAHLFGQFGRVAFRRHQLLPSPRNRHKHRMRSESTKFLKDIQSTLMVPSAADNHNNRCLLAGAGPCRRCG